jgi:predicted RNA-binding Zn ribbon-like protein
MVTHAKITNRHPYPPMADTSANSLAPDVPFLYVGGDPALDLVNTVDYTDRGLEQDRLTSYDRVIEWAEGAGILSSKQAASFRAQARARPRQAEAAVRTTLRVRQVVGRLFSAMAQREPGREALDDFNRLLGQALQEMRVTRAGERRRSSQTLRLGWENLEKSLESIVWPVVWSAASLIVSEEASRIRICGGGDCGWVYVDRSRNGLRRWCQMETCGTREKSRRRYQRHRLA